MDSMMLVPISGTCHRLREVVLGNPLLWTHGKENRIPMILTRSQSAPIALSLTTRSISSSSERILCLVLQPKHIMRIRELHMFGDEDDGRRQLYDNFHRSLWPALEHLTLSCRYKEPSRTSGVPGAARLLPFQGVSEHMPRLRYLSLKWTPSWMPPYGLPALTHLSLDFMITGENMLPLERLVGFISMCPKLESVFLSLPRTEDDNTPQSVAPIPSMVLPRLRRVKCLNNSSGTLRILLSAFALHTRKDIAVQILCDRGGDLMMLPWETILPYDPRGCENISALAILQHAAPEPEQQSSIFNIDTSPLLSITAIVSSRTTVRVACSSRNLCADLERGVLGQAFFSDVHDVWIGVAQEYLHTAVISALLAPIPAIETITLVTDYALHGDSRSFSPSFRLVPKSSERRVGSARVRTLRFVHGYGDYEDSGCRRSQASGVDAAPTKLNLNELLSGLGSGEYDYFDELLLQITAHLEVDEEEVAKLRACVRVMRVERIECMPEPPIPKISEEAASSQQRAHAASLW
ncbi:hypothetical protein C8Q80DRAFT_1134702 [Daedaleopsis nitida]|nr:hypothetical protein C8Q80DRAFT_1134702 [Daedaleopsis nitida]